MQTRDFFAATRKSRCINRTDARSSRAKRPTEGDGARFVQIARAAASNLFPRRYDRRYLAVTTAIALVISLKSRDYRGRKSSRYRDDGSGRFVDVADALSLN